MFSPYLDDNDPVDHDALYMNLCARRESHSHVSCEGTESGFEGLFFPKGGIDEAAEQSLLETMILGRSAV